MKNSFENCLINQCAPTLAGVKPGNLFSYIADDQENVDEILRGWNDKLSGKGILITLLRGTGKGNLVFVYRPKALERIIKDQSISSFLKAYGYCDIEYIEEYIERLDYRMNTSSFFPHEVGIFLGYPLQDVIGFIENEGKNACCCGSWKAYSKQDDAKNCFRQFKKCTSIYKRLFNSGRTVIQLTVAA